GDGSKPLPLPTGVGSTSGPALFAPPPLPPMRSASHEDPVDPGSIRSAEDGQAALEAMGAKGQRLEQTSAGDWRFSCTRESRLFEAREMDRLDAIRTVVEQMRKDR
ncbi:MAG TPA: hypothetical protein VKE40_09960, partial [Gemmataceae bacterium]|nr:hypothetical protein [Gemmataceae bacterium]